MRPPATQLRAAGPECRSMRLPAARLRTARHSPAAWLRNAGPTWHPMRLPAAWLRSPGPEWRPMRSPDRRSPSAGSGLSARRQAAWLPDAGAARLPNQLTGQPPSPGSGCQPPADSEPWLPSAESGRLSTKRLPSAEPGRRIPNAGPERRPAKPPSAESGRAPAEPDWRWARWPPNAGSRRWRAPKRPSNRWSAMLILMTGSRRAPAPLLRTSRPRSRQRSLMSAGSDPRSAIAVPEPEPQTAFRG